jgi:hypothetical protein
MSKPKEKQRISIVFNDTGGDGFNVFLDGHTRDLSQLKEEDFSPAEWWALAMFRIVMHELKECGAIQKTGPRPNNGVKQ